MKRRSRVRVAVADTPEPRQLPINEQVSAYRAMNPNTSAHDTDQDCPCWVCGGPVATGGLHWGPWRQHHGCGALRGDPVDRLVAASRALGRDLSRQDAALLPYSASLYVEVHPEPTWTDEPTRDRLRWHHLDRQALDRAIELLPELRADAGLTETTCTDGPCAWCGVLEARGWASHGHTWHDGTPAPLCGSCSTIYERSGSPDPSWWEAQRAGIAEAITSVPIMMGEQPPPGLAGFAEGEGDSEGSPWSHLSAEAVEAYRWDRWGRHGGRYAPAEHRSEALDRARAADAAGATRMAAIEAEKRRKADIFGFAGGAR